MTANATFRDQNCCLLVKSILSWVAVSHSILMCRTSCLYDCAVPNVQEPDVRIEDIISFFPHLLLSIKKLCIYS
jgi:hypothetical protein